MGISLFEMDAKPAAALSTIASAGGNAVWQTREFRESSLTFNI
jgi:hypothetical protein